MRFALLGGHPDGVEMACALVESGRHQLGAYTAAADGATLRRWGDARRVSDVEEVLAGGVAALILAAVVLALALALRGRPGPPAPGPSAPEPSTNRPWQ